MQEEKQKIIAKLRAKGIEFNPNAQIKTLERLLVTDASPDVVRSVNVSTKTDTPIQSYTASSPLDEVMNALRGISDRLDKLENKGNDFKMEASQEDIDQAAKNKQALDPRLVQIVESSLGVDFGIDVQQFADRPGFEFTILVPKRLSDVLEDTRPKRNDDDTAYVKTSDGSVVMETYWPGDRRSIAIGSLHSYEAIKQHCDRVRSYIVSYYTKMRQPLPEFKVK